MNHSIFVPIHLVRIMRSRRGAATLPTVIALSLLILAVGVSITAVSFTEGLLSYGQGNASAAFLYAQSGARDALIRIARSKQYACASANCYAIEFASGGCASGDACAQVSVSTGAGTAGDPRIIVSRGQAQNSIRTIQVEVVFDTALHGEIASTTWKEI